MVAWITVSPTAKPSPGRAGCLLPLDFTTVGCLEGGTVLGAAGEAARVAVRTVAEGPGLGKARCAREAHDEHEQEEEAATDEHHQGARLCPRVVDHELVTRQGGAGFVCHGD